MTPERGCAVRVSDEPWLGDLAVTGPEAVTPERIVEAARRKLGLPLIIAEWEGIVLRELTPEDHPAVRALVREEDADGILWEGISSGGSSSESCSFEGFPSEARLADPEYYDAYVRNQYPLFGYGLWGLFRKDSGQLLGIAGFSAPPDDGSDLELGFHIAEAFRRHGYAMAACRAALAYVSEELGAERITLRIRRENRPSLCFSEKLKTSLPQMKGRFRFNITIL